MKVSKQSAYASLLGVFSFVALSSLANAQVAYDVNPLVVARDVGYGGLINQMPNSRMVEVQLDVSALFKPGESAKVTEYTVKMTSRHDDVQVADYFPRTELQSDVQGTMQVTQDADRVREASIRGAGGYPGAGSVYGYAYGHDNSKERIVYARKPAMELATASGTLERRRGVYFKVKESTQSTLEGARPFRIVFEVPSHWRADLLDVTVETVGFESASSKKQRLLSVQKFVVAVYQEFDERAAAVANNYVKQHMQLAQSAKMHASTIEHRSYPTPLHKLGAKLDIYEPNIPQNWFESLVYTPGTTYSMEKISRLPVDLRVTILNYLDQKGLVEQLSGCIPHSQVATAPAGNYAQR